MREKTFYYTGKDYINRGYKEKYTRVSRWIKINYTPTEESRPFFRHNNKRYYFDDIIRSNYPGTAPTEVRATDGETVLLSGHESTTYYKPLFVELDDGGEAVRLYRYEGTETE